MGKAIYCLLEKVVIFPFRRQIEEVDSMKLSIEISLLFQSVWLLFSCYLYHGV